MKLVETIILLILILFIFYYALNLRYNFMNRNIGEPWLIETTHSLLSSKRIPSKLIRRSNDSKYGVEFTYTMWLYVATWPSDGYRHHILHKGEQSDTIPLLQAPSLYLDNGTNKLIVNMNSLNSINNEIKIDNIPVQKWFHITIMLINRNLDVFVNGRLKQRKQLDSPPKQNYGNLYISQGNTHKNDTDGVHGYISRLRYFNYAIPFWRIDQVVQQGPSRAPCPTTGSIPPTLAPDWWNFKK